MAVESAEDLAGFFDPDEFAVPAVRSGTAIYVIVDYDVTVLDDSGLSRRISTVTAPQSLSRGETLTIAAVDWVVGRLIEQSADGAIWTYEITPYIDDDD